MNSSKKITFTLFAIVSLLAIMIITLVSISSRHIVYDGAKRKAHLTAELVKNALTHQMVNNTIGLRNDFLNKLNNIGDIKDVWIVRSKSVNEQFGSDALLERPKDHIDLEVLKTGEEKVLTHETIEDVNLRITIPYVASDSDNPNCMSCHNAKEGEVLGAISLVFDINEDRNSNIVILIHIALIISIFLVIILLLIKQKITPFTNFLDSLTQTLKKVHDGDYTVRAKEGTLKEDKEATAWLNDLIEKLDVVLTKIERHLTSFVHNRVTSVHKDKLLAAKDIVEDISEIYSYKKTIETDLTKEDIYYRLVQVLKNKLNIETFYIFETNLFKDERSIIYATEDIKDKIPYCTDLKNIKTTCRAERTNTIVFSDNFPEICRVTKYDESLFSCIPFLINDQINIIIHVICKDAKSMKHLKDQIGIIKKYLEETKPILESKILMEALRERNLTDELTKLYNRRYLEEFIEKKLPLELDKGSTFAVMFLDIDYFKMVNDTFGHDIGDRILKKLSDTIKSMISDNDFIVRFGGEEFLVIMKNPTEESALALAQKINKDFAQIVFNYDGQPFSKTISIGYSLFPSDTAEIWKCIKYADISLYEAKETGRNKIIRFTNDLLKNNDKKSY